MVVNSFNVVSKVQCNNKQLSGWKVINWNEIFQWVATLEQLIRMSLFKILFLNRNLLKNIINYFKVLKILW